MPIILNAPFLTVLALIFMLGGCAGKYTPSHEPVMAEEPTPYEHIISHYYFQPGDTIEIKFFRNPELNESVVVRPDGKIALQLIDEVEVAGFTPPQLQLLLNDKYAPHLKNLMTTVLIKSFGGQKVYVGGQVNTPGIVNLIGRTSVVHAIFEAGGVRADANISDVLVISRGADSRPMARKINIKKAIKGKLPEEELLLKPYDMVYVPKSLIVEANEFVYHLYNFIPPNVWFGFSYELHNEPNRSE